MLKKAFEFYDQYPTHGQKYPETVSGLIKVRGQIELKFPSNPRTQSKSVNIYDIMNQHGQGG